MTCLANKVITGVPGLDTILDGGYPQGRTVLVSGPPGVGKTIMALQFLLAGLQSGEKAIYITLDQQAPHLIADADAAGLSVGPYLENNTLKILDLTHYFNHTESIQDGVFSATQLVEDIRRFIVKFGAKRVVMDPVSPLIFRHSTGMAVLEYLRQLIAMMESKIESTVVLIAYAKPDALDQHNSESFAVAGVIQLQQIVAADAHHRYVCVHKMRGSAIQAGCFSMDIVQGTGVVIRA